MTPTILQITAIAVAVQCSSAFIHSQTPKGCWGITTTRSSYDENAFSYEGNVDPYSQGSVDPYTNYDENAQSYSPYQENADSYANYGENAEAFAPSYEQTYEENADGYSTHDENVESQLILGENMQKALSGIGASETSILDASRKRNEEAKLKFLEEQRREEYEAQQRASQKENSEANFGPGDMSGFQGFADDGFESSTADGAGEGWEIQNSNEEQVEEEEPQLFLFDQNDTGGDLIL
mmetsp:Transcript_8817/g.12531  ORF Transcript_8817/g.12531 Transcript_8817/m.12531 type:complete len:238 (-) Transcript_8817:281-994(-)|eukprot:CAMPEP_0184867380 /NCGR_PEP_ID=MMETSP0580-20130426/26283_1 /TAXON_ID=1118495 /ORGANISM="Dactyliosolen fragilissimus" /LENGTH=237 /DNA_ID=CAMNT_0027367627 /DNA_START=90 /DNA_END=803 /DNA_ORIENTATION=-